jgi:hypothetical protein
VLKVLIVEDNLMVADLADLAEEIFNRQRYQVRGARTSTDAVIDAVGPPSFIAPSLPRSVVGTANRFRDRLRDRRERYFVAIISSGISMPKSGPRSGDRSRENRRLIDAAAKVRASKAGQQISSIFCKAPRFLEKMSRGFFSLDQNCTDFPMQLSQFNHAGLVARKPRPSQTARTHNGLPVTASERDCIAIPHPGCNQTSTLPPISCLARVGSPAIPLRGSHSLRRAFRPLWSAFGLDFTNPKLGFAQGIFWQTRIWFAARERPTLIGRCFNKQRLDASFPACQI